MIFAHTHPAVGDPVQYTYRVVSGIHLHVIDIDLDDPHAFVAPAIADHGIGRTESFSSFISRLHPTAAINGTFFGKRSLRPVADIVIDGKLVHFGGMGTALAFTADGVDIIRLPKSRHVDWSEHISALAGGPLLVWDSFAKPMPGGEGFGDPAVFARAAPRTAVGVTSKNHLLLVTTVRGSSLRKLAEALKALGAAYAFNLDGGSSSGMYHKGRLVLRPKRNLTNILCVWVKPDPISERPRRAPRGLDWRTGHEPRPVLYFAAADLKISVKLPRRWEGRGSVSVTADKPLPDGWKVVVRLDDDPPTAIANSLPADLVVDLTDLPGEKHRLWIEILDDRNQQKGRTERIFRPGTTGIHAW